MALPQGIDFRAALGYVTDPANCFYDSISSDGITYPRTSAQGNNVGYESPSGLNYRDRNNGNDPRLAGINYHSSGLVQTYRIDLPATGAHNVRVAMGDPSATWSGLKCELFDNTTSLGVLVNGNATGSNRFFDATNTEYTAAAWPGSNTAVAKTFASTICRFKFGNGSNLGPWAHIYIEAAGGSGLNVTSIYTPADASGYQARADLQRSITALQAVASASGFTAKVDLQRNVASVFTPAYALGYVAGVNLTRNISATLAQAQASGFDATVSLAGSLNIPASLGVASATGNTARVDLQYQVSAALGVASAVGFDASISNASAPFSQDELDYLLSYMQEHLMIPTAEQVAAAVLLALQATAIPVNIKQVNDVTIKGAGVTGTNPWGPV